jgi:hypothetical protein
VPFCSKCGTEVGDDAFCFNCGAKIESETTDTMSRPEERPIDRESQTLFSPSELVLFNGEKFANKGMMGNVELMISGTSVSAAQLGKAILSAALIANEQMGVIQLEITEKKASFGLRKEKLLNVRPIKPTNDWPEYSLESQIYSLAQNMGKNTEVFNLVYTWLKDDSFAPWEKIIEYVQEGLSNRGLLGKTEETKMGIFKSNVYSLPQNTVSLIQGSSIEPVRQMLNEYSYNRKDEWSLLQKQIEKAINERTD